jgi:hypothetical protein
MQLGYHSTGYCGQVLRIHCAHSIALASLKTENMPGRLLAWHDERTTVSITPGTQAPRRDGLPEEILQEDNCSKKRVAFLALKFGGTANQHKSLLPLS